MATGKLGCLGDGLVVVLVSVNFWTTGLIGTCSSSCTPSDICCEGYAVRPGKPLGQGGFGRSGATERVDRVGRSVGQLTESQSTTDNKLHSGTGNHFCRPVPMMPATGPDQSLLLLLTNNNDHKTSVHFTDFPSFSSSSSSSSSSSYLSSIGDVTVFTIPAKNYTMITIPRPFSTTPSQSSSALGLWSVDKVDACFINLGSCASFLSLQNPNLGVVYEAITWTPQSSYGISTINIMAAIQSTFVQIQFPSGSCQIQYGYMTFFCGDLVTLDMSYLETATFTTSGSGLTGTLITSLSSPLAVFVGNSNVTIGPSSIVDQTVEQLFPIGTWGMQFALAPVPENGNSGYSIVVTSGGQVANVVVSGTAYAVTSRSPLSLDVPNNIPLYVQSDVRVQVVQFVRGAAVSTNDSGAPASIVIPAVTQYQSSYAYTNPPGYVHYVTVIIAASNSITNMGTLLVDNVAVSTTGWSTILGSTMVTKAIMLPSDGGYSMISHSTGALFGAVRYSFIRGNCAFGYPAGAQLLSYTRPSTVALPSPTTPGFVASTLAPTTLFTEPINVGCQADNMGTSFLIAFMENIQPGVYDLELFPATFSGLPDIVVSVTAPGADTVTQGKLAAGGGSFVLLPGQSHAIDVPGQLEMSGTGQSSQAVQVTSTQPIGVYGMNSVNGSCDGFLAFPISSLGTVYYTLAYFPPDDKSQIGIIASQNGTVVNVTLRAATRPAYNVIWNGKVYSNGQTLTIPMNQYDTVEIQDNSDLTGTFVTSNFPVAVFSGNDFTQVISLNSNNPSFLVEQIPPVQYWGSTFYIVPIPQSQAGIEVKVVGSTANTILSSVYTNNSVPKITTLSNPGDSMFITFSAGIFVKVTTTNPTLVGLFVASNDVSFPAMMIVPPAEQFNSWYTFSTGRNIFTTFTNYLLLVCDWSAIPRLLLDGVPVNQTGWTNFTGDATKAGTAIPISSGVHLIRQMDNIPFGAYVYGASSENCAYAYPAGICLGTTNQTQKSFYTTSAPTVLPPPSITDCSCLTVTSSMQPQYSGVYYLQSTLYNGQALYRRIDCTVYIYWNGAWFISSQLGGNTAALVAYTGLYQSPYEANSWIAYSASNGSFQLDPSSEVTCSCPVPTQCQTVQLQNTTSGANLYDGVFTQVQTTYNGRPVFWQEAENFFFFYEIISGSAGGNCEYWTVGQGESVSQVVDSGLRLYDNVQDPALLANISSGAWLVYNIATGTFVSVPGGVTFSCFTSAAFQH